MNIVPHDTDWADEAVDEIIDDLNDRSGLGLDDVDDDILVEIETKWAEIIRRHVGRRPAGLATLDEALYRTRTAERDACADLARSAGCACARSTEEGPDGWIDGLDPVEYGSYIAPLVVKVHNPQCPYALAAAIEARR